ncbi:Ig-like domain-containing protein [Hyalangium versicolor]|uniref:Ig-like domain-containing protein n=1 Tax=Hyalangium versicolor TaxID=2861190 RepID=UPI001CCA0FE6|nr:Ig-like domain-containing protein [Hyalangium versicolor]
MRRLPLAVLLIVSCALPLASGCGDDESPSKPPVGTDPLPDAGIPDGGAPDAGPGDTVAPAVLSSTPAEGTTGLYPVEVYYRTSGQAGLSERKVLTLQFSEPMDTVLTQAPLLNLTDTSAEPRTVEGTWSTDGQQLTLPILQPEEGGPALEENTSYAVDLKGFRDVAGNRLDAVHPVLGDGRLDFTTGPNDLLLNHACGHTLVDTILPVSASATPTGTVPRMDQTHKYYEVTAPMESGAYSGYTRMRLPPETSYILYLDHEVPVSLSTFADNEPVESSSEAVPPACQGITHRVRFTTPDSPELRVHFIPPGAKLRAILEESF